MTFRGVAPISIAVIALLVVPALSAFQAAQDTTAVRKNKKASKVKTDAAAKPLSTADKGTSASGRTKKEAAEARTTASKSKKAHTNKALKENTEAAGNGAASATNTARKATGRVNRAATASADRVVSPATDAVSTTRSNAARIVSGSEIATAKASGEVWVNTETGVYHRGGKWYGATKQGKFMTEQEAAKAGYRAAKTK